MQRRRKVIAQYVMVLLACVVLTVQLTESGSAEVTTAPTLVSPPTGTSLTRSDFMLYWSNPPSTTQNHIQITPYNGDGPRLNLILDAATSFEHIGANSAVILPGMSYAWRVRATDYTAFAPEDSPAWGPWSEERTFRMPAPTSTTITPLWPVDGAAEVYRTSLSYNPPSIHLHWWDTSPEVFYYEIQVSTDPEFRTGPDAIAAVWWNLIHGRVSLDRNAWRTPALENSTTYYWRVRPRVQGDGTPVQWSPSWSFTTSGAFDSPPTDSAPDAPSLVLPAADTVIQQNDPSTGCGPSFKISGYRIFFNWDDVRGAVMYQVVLQGKGAFRPALDTQTYVSDYYHISCGSFAYADTSWTWRARARNYAGVWGEWSEERSLRFAECRLASGEACESVLVVPTPTPPSGGTPTPPAATPTRAPVATPTAYVPQ